MISVSHFFKSFYFFDKDVISQNFLDKIIL